MVRYGTVVLALLAGCGGGQYGESQGSINTTPFQTIESAWFGGPYLLLFDREVDCIDTAWVQQSYFDGIAPDGAPPFVALQFSSGSDEYTVGTSSVEGDAPVTAFGLLNASEPFEVVRGRTGALTITSADGEWLEGSYEVGFTDGSTTGEFRAEFCRNMAP